MKRWTVPYPERYVPVGNAVFVFIGVDIGMFQRQAVDADFLLPQFMGLTRYRLLNDTRQFEYFLGFDFSFCNSFCKYWASEWLPFLNHMQSYNCNLIKP